MQLAMVEIDKCFSLVVYGEGQKLCVEMYLRAQIKILPGCTS